MHSGRKCSISLTLPCHTLLRKEEAKYERHGFPLVHLNTRSSTKRVSGGSESPGVSAGRGREVAAFLGMLRVSGLARRRAEGGAAPRALGAGEREAEPSTSLPDFSA